MTTVLDTPTSEIPDPRPTGGQNAHGRDPVHYRGCDRVICARSEYLSLTGSIKDRMALRILQQAYTEGISEATSQHRDCVCRAGPHAGTSGENLHARLDEPGARATDQELRRGNRIGQQKGWRVPGQYPDVRRVCGVASRRVSAAAILKWSECGCARRHHRSGNLVATDERR
jgi:hypothetical protein